MTKSQNTKNEQQKDLCITSEQLTEQWKQGELPNGYYWIRLSWGGMVIMAYHTAFDGLFELDDHYYDSDEISEVLAPVPSYEEWIGVKQQRDLENKLRHDSDNKNWQLRTENQQLKELLEECRHIIGIEKDFATCHFEEYTLVELLTKIDEVLK